MNKRLEDFLRRWGVTFGKAAPHGDSVKIEHAGQRAASSSSSANTRNLVGGRVSADRPDTFYTGALSLLAPFSQNPYLRQYDLDSRTLNRIPITKLVEILIDNSPEVSRAVFDYLLFGNNGFEVKAYKPNTDRKTEDPVAQKSLNAFLGRLKDFHGSVDVPIWRILIGSFLRGALFTELVLDLEGRQAVDLATPDPVTARFKAIPDEVRGTIYQLGQMQKGEFVPLDRPTIKYIPIHPLPGSPWGRPLVSPAIFSSLFLLGLFHDLKRVIQQQGYPRYDVSVNMADLVATMPPDVKSDPTKADEWFQKAYKTAQEMYANLEPDDAFFHSDAVKMNRPVGTVDSKSLGAVDGMVRALERMATRALKTMPLLMGSNEAVSETHANRQWEIHVAGVKSIQHLIETMLEGHCQIALQAEGIAAEVQWRFAELRAAEELRDEQVRGLRNRNIAFEYDRGWRSQEECALEAVGHKADQDKPRAQTTDTAGLPGIPANADPGSNRTREQQDLLYRSYQIETQGKVSFVQWWQERLGNPFTWDEAWERLKESYGAGMVRVPPSQQISEAGGTQ